jgi:hypothetical protein
MISQARQDRLSTAVMDAANDATRERWLVDV